MIPIEIPGWVYSYSNQIAVLQPHKGQVLAISCLFLPRITPRHVNSRLTSNYLRVAFRMVSAVSSTFISEESTTIQPF